MRRFALVGLMASFLLTSGCLNPEPGLDIAGKGGSFQLGYRIVSVTTPVSNSAGRCATVELRSLDVSVLGYLVTLFDGAYGTHAYSASTGETLGDGEGILADELTNRTLHGSYDGPHTHYLPGTMHLEIPWRTAAADGRFELLLAHLKAVAGSCWSHCHNVYDELGVFDVNITGLECGSAYTIELYNSAEQG